MNTSKLNSIIRATARWLQQPSHLVRLGLLGCMFVFGFVAVQAVRIGMAPVQHTGNIILDAFASYRALSATANAAMDATPGWAMFTLGASYATLVAASIADDKREKEPEVPRRVLGVTHCALMSCQAPLVWEVLGLDEEGWYGEHAECECGRVYWLAHNDFLNDRVRVSERVTVMQHK